MSTMSRPAEKSGALFAAVTAIAALLGADTATVAVAGTIAGTVPAAVTWIVNNGGIKGAAARLWNGKR